MERPCDIRTHGHARNTAVGMWPSSPLAMAGARRFVTFNQPPKCHADKAGDVNAEAEVADRCLQCPKSSPTS